MKFTLTEVQTVELVPLKRIEGMTLFYESDGWKLYEKSCSHMIDGQENLFTLRFQRIISWERK